MLKYLFYYIAVILFFASNAFADNRSLQPEEGFGRKKSQLTTGKTFMVATAHPLASKVGFEILEKGGTAAGLISIALRSDSSACFKCC